MKQWIFVLPILDSVGRIVEKLFHNDWLEFTNINKFYLEEKKYMQRFLNI